MNEEKNEYEYQNEEDLLDKLNGDRKQFLFRDRKKEENRELIESYCNKLLASGFKEEEKVFITTLIIKICANASSIKLRGYKKNDPFIETGLNYGAEDFVKVIIEELRLKKVSPEWTYYFLAKDSIDLISVKLIQQECMITDALKQYSDPKSSEIKKRAALILYGESFYAMAKDIEKNIERLKLHSLLIANAISVKNPTLGNNLKTEVDNKIIECEFQLKIALEADTKVKAAQYPDLKTSQEKKEIINNFINRMMDFESSESECLREFVSNFVKGVTDENFEESIQDSSDSESAELNKIFPAAQKNTPDTPEEEFALAIKTQLTADFNVIKQKCTEAEKHWQGNKDQKTEDLRLKAIKSINAKLQEVNGNNPPVKKIFAAIKAVKKIYTKNEDYFYKTRDPDSKKRFEFLKWFLDLVGINNNITPAKSTSSHAKSVEEALSIKPNKPK